MPLLRFFKPKWQHRDPAVRRRAVARLSPRDAADRQILAGLACGDAEPEVRRAAVKALSDLLLLRERLEQEQDGVVRETAAIRYRQLLAGGMEDAGLETRLAELAYCHDPLVLAHVARSAREAELRQAALARVSSSSVLADAAINDSVRAVRQSALDRLQDVAALERVEYALRECDKGLARQARERRQQLLATAEHVETGQAQYQALLLELEAHARAPVGEGYAAATARLKNRWRMIDATPAPAAAERYRQALEACGQRALAATATRSASAVDAAAEACAALRAEWERWAIGAAADESCVAALRNGMAAAAERWAAARPTAEQQMTYRQLWDELEAGLALAERNLTEREALAATLEAQLAQSAEQEAEQAARRWADFNGALRSLEDALERRELRLSQEHLKQARELAQQLAEGAGREALQLLRPLQARLNELRDWRRFATLPKQQELCERMEALPEKLLEAPELARQIKQLQQEWEATGGSDSAQARRLWERFRAASSQAFEPCQQYFAEQARQREINLAQRGVICEQLQQFMTQADWESLDGDFLAKVRQQARAEWQAAAPVDRKQGKRLQRQFDGLMRQLSGRIDAAGELRRQQREQLLAQAQALSAQADRSGALDQVKALQAQWRELGRWSTAAERKLADRFRQVCNGIYEQRGEQRAARERVREQDLEQAQALCEQAAALVQQPDDELDAALARAKELAQQLAALAPLPRNRLEQLRARMRQTLEAIEQRLQARAARQQQQQLEWLEQGARLCGRLETLVGLPGEECAPVLEQLEREWSALPAQPAPLAQRWLQAREALAGGFDDAVLAANAERRRRLCVRLEILAGLESPAADSQLRLDLQVERLARGMAARQSESDEQQVRELVLEWYAVGADGGASERLHARWQTALQELQAVV